MKRCVSIAILLFLFLSPSLTWGHEWTIDASHSGFRFGVQHIFSTVWGHFSDFEGKIKFDPDNLSQSAFEATVKVKSINTSNEKRDIHLRSDEFFAVDKYPTMHFSSSKITHKGGKHYLITGTMTIKETRRTMDIPFTYKGTVQSPFNEKEWVAGFDTEFIVNRLDFGVGTGKFNKMGVLDKFVRILISVEAVRKN